MNNINNDSKRCARLANNYYLFPGIYGIAVLASLIAILFYATEKEGSNTAWTGIVIKYSISLQFLSLIFLAVIYVKQKRRSLLPSACIALLFGLFLAIMPSSFETLKNEPFYTLRVAYAIIVLLGAFYVFWFRTFRVIPSAFLAISVALLYTVSLTFVTGPISYWGFKTEKASVLLQLKDSVLLEWFGWGLLGSAVAAFIGEAAKSAWYNISGSTADENAQIGYRFKQQRRKMLSQGYHCNHLLPIGVTFLLLVIAVFVLLSLRKEGETLNSLLRLFLVAISIGFAGVAMCFVITDENLLKAESAYLNYRIHTIQQSINTKGEQTERQKANWRNYSQVLANFFASRSALVSVDARIHKWPDFFTYMKKTGNICSNCELKYCSDVLQMYCSLQKMFARTESNCPKKNTLPGPAEDTLCEIRFATVIDNTLLQKYSATPNSAGSIPIRNYRMGDVLHLAMGCYFNDEDTAWWRQSFSNVPVSQNEMKSLLLLDILKYLVTQYSELQNCCLEWMCRKGTDYVPMLAFLLEFPYIAMDMLWDRWKVHLGNGSKPLHSHFTKAHSHIIAKYYYYLFDKRLNSLSVQKDNDVDDLVRIAEFMKEFMVNTNREKVCFEELGVQDDHDHKFLKLNVIWKRLELNLTHSSVEGKFDLKQLFSEEEIKAAMRTNEPLTNDPYRFLTRIIFAKE